MLIPFSRRIRRHVFSYSGLKFCPSVSFSAVWPPLYKRTCGHFSSCDCKLLVNTIFFLANRTAATQCIWSCGRGEDTSLKFRASSGGKNEDSKWLWTWRMRLFGVRRVAGLPVFHRLPLCCWDSHRIRTISRVCRENADNVQWAGGRRCADVRGQNGRLVGGRRKVAVTQTSSGDSQGLQKSVCVQ